MAALVEGLAGVKNRGLAFDSCRIIPEMDASADIDSAKVTIRFPASEGYVSYN